MFCSVMLPHGQLSASFRARKVAYIFSVHENEKGGGGQSVCPSVSQSVRQLARKPDSQPVSQLVGQYETPTDSQPASQSFSR